MLQTRHARADLIETFKILNKLEDINPDVFKVQQLQAQIKLCAL